jgi:hypothetical protein
MAYPQDWNDLIQSYKRSKVYHAIVGISGTTVCAIDADGNEILSGTAGTDDSIVIQAALNNLTSNRTSKETVVLKGNFTIPVMLQIPSFTTLVIESKLIEAPSKNLSAIIRNKNCGTSLDTNIEITGGGIIDGNSSNSATGHGILLDGVTDCSIHNLMVKNVGGPSGRGIYITTSNTCRVTKNVNLTNLFVDNSTDSNVEISGTAEGYDAIAVYGAVITNLFSTNAGGRGLCFTNARNSTVNGLYINTAGSRGIDCSYCSTDNVFTNLYIANTTLDGITIARSPGVSPSDRNVFSNFIVYNAASFGLNIAASDCTVTNGLIYNSQWDGIRITGNRNTICGVISKNNGQAATNTYQGIDVRSANNIIIGNSYYDDQKVQTQRYGMSFNSSSSNCIVMFNNVSRNLQANAIIDAGIGNLIRSNIGYVTENSGTATVNSGTTSTTVTHGLNYTPSLGDIVVTPTNNMGNATKFYISDPTSTQFTINVNSDPGATTATFSWAVRKI